MSTANNSAPAVWKFSIEIQPVIDGYNLKASRPDAQGYFPVNVAALGIPTRAEMVYNVPPFLKCMQDPDTRFNIMLREGYLYGHADHPKVIDKKDLPLLMDIDHQKASHHFRSVYAGNILPNGAHLICADVKPWGPYKQELTENLLDPNMNTSFSVRSLCKEYLDRVDGKIHRDVQILITFDWVTGPGFANACTRYTPNVGTESFSIDVTPEDFFTPQGVACEGYSTTELMKAFGITTIPMGTGRANYFRGRGYRHFIDSTGTRRSLVHHFLK